MKITLTVEYDSQYGENLEEELEKFLKSRHDEPQSTPKVNIIPRPKRREE